MARIWHWVVGLGLSLGACLAWASSCSQTLNTAFPGAVNAFSTTHAVVEFNCDANVISNPTNTLNAETVTNPSANCAKTCGGANCEASGSRHAVTLTYGDFNTSAGGSAVTVKKNQTQTIGSDSEQNFTNITVRQNATLNFNAQSGTTVYKIDTLKLNNAATATLAPGIYWIKELILNSSSTVNISGAGTVRLYIKDKFSVSSGVAINDSSDTHAAKKLLILSQGETTANLTFSSGSRMKGFLQHRHTLHVAEDVAITGAVSADTVTLNARASVTFDANAASLIEANELCDADDDGESDQPLCSASFPSGLSAHDVVNPDAIVKFYCGAQFIGAPSSVLTAEFINNPSPNCAKTCETEFCSATGAPEINKLSYGTFQATSSNQDVTATSSNTLEIGANDQVEYRNLTANSQGTLTFLPHSAGTTYKLSNLTVNSYGTVNLVAGDYWLDKLIIQDNGHLVVQGSGTARLYVRGQLSIGNQAEVNNSTATDAAAKLFILSRGEIYEDVYIGSNTIMKAFLYHEDDVIVQSNTQYTGGITAEDIDLHTDVKVYWSNPDALQGSALCQGSNSPAVASFGLQMNHYSYFCDQESVVVSALDASQTVVPTYAGTILLNTGTGTGQWVLTQGSGTLSDTDPADGIAEYTFGPSDQGVATFTLIYTSGDPSVVVTVQEQGNANTSTSAALTYEPYGFLLTETALSNPTGTEAAFAKTLTAGVPETLHLSVYGPLETGQCALLSSYSGSKSLQFWHDYTDPSSGTQTVSINGADIGTSEAQAVSTPVSFSQGQASVALQYNDVGKLKLYTKAQAPSGGNILGATNPFVVKPAALRVTVPSNPAATDANGGVFNKAGQSFPITVHVEDAHGNPTPNFGKETTPESLHLSASTLVAPSGGRNGSQNDGAIGNGHALTETSPGVWEGSDFTYDEVGIIKLTAKVASDNYLGAGPVSGPESDNVGRFTPNHFSSGLNSPSFSANCHTFSYLGAPVQYGVAPTVILQAESVSNTPTQNYQGAYFKLVPSSVVQTYQVSGPATLWATAASNTATLADQGQGTGLAQLGDGGGITLLKPTGVPTAPFDAEMQLAVIITDSDGITHTVPIQFGGMGSGEGIPFSGSKTFHHGRLVVENNYGSELLPLTIPLRIEAYNGAEFVPHTQDACTLLPANAVQLTAEPTSLSSTPTVVPFKAGQGSIQLSPPSNGETGQVDILLDLSVTGANLPHLQHDWPHDGDADGTYSDNPQSRGTFGIYQGKENVIYIQEVP